MNVIVIEDYNLDGCEWGISFTNSNPESPDYFKMPDKETAFRIKGYLTKCPPISLNNPLSLPVNKFSRIEG